MTNLVPINGPRAPGVRPEILSVCTTSEQLSEYFNTATALADLKDRGFIGEVPAAAAKTIASLAPVDHNRLTDRLTALGMMMSPNRPPAEARIWLNEMVRLLADLPEDILSDAIDGLVKGSKFLPTCSEIRERADPEVTKRRRIAAQLDAMRRYIESGQPIPDKPKWDHPKEPEQIIPCTEAEAAAIMAEFGLNDRSRAVLRPHLGPPRKPTREDYIAMGVDPATLTSQ